MKTKCTFCGKNTGTEWCVSEGFKIIKCQCGILYPNPRLSIGEINKLYNENELSGIQDYLEVEKDNIKDFRRRIKYLMGFSNPKTMLDIGCNIGNALEVAEDLGIEAEGVDVNKSAIDIAKKKGLNAKVKDFNKIDKQYDLIFMNDLIEHLEDPLHSLNKINELCKKKGYIYITTPKVNSLVCKMMKEKWIHMKPQQHLYLFPQEVIIKMLNQKGFSIINLRTIGRIRSVELILKKLESYSKPVSKVAKFLTYPIKNLSIPINVFDEMEIIAMKNREI
jgi:2-polyprenyl-3-methyl-5-hydroxy-6-metoxy-1,4-benzoquinol methylase